MPAMAKQTKDSRMQIDLLQAKRESTKESRQSRFQRFSLEKGSVLAGDQISVVQGER